MRLLRVLREAAAEFGLVDPPDECDHPLRRTTVRDEFYVYCWACRRTLPEPEAWLVVRRWQALDR